MRLWRYLRRPAFRGVWAGLACAVVAALLGRWNFARGLDDWFFDGCFVLRDAFRGKNLDPGPVVIIGIYEKDYDLLGKPSVFISPELARVVTHARRSGATAVGIDLLIPNSLSAGHKDFFREVGNPATFGKAVRAVDKVVLPVSFPGVGPPVWPIEQWLLKYRNPDYRDPFGRDVASVDLYQDKDRFVRRAHVLVSSPAEELFPSFPFALVAWAQDKPYRWEPETKTAWLGDDPIPLGPDQHMAINWAGRPGTFPTVPFGEVLEAAKADRPCEELRGKIAIVGSTAQDTQDFHPTPYSNGYASWFGIDTSSAMPGPEIHAHAAATLFRRSFITTPVWLHPWPWLAAAGVGLGWLLVRLTPLPGLAVAVAYVVGWETFATAVLTFGNLRAELIAMFLLGGITYTVAFILRWRVVRRLLAATKSQALAKALEADPGRLDLAGENRAVSVLFVDVRGFSAFSSEHPGEPHRIVAVLNAYYTAVVPGVEAEGGTVNLFVGDGMMVLFNAPLDHPDHAVRAVRAARGIVRTVRAKAAMFETLGFSGFRVGVGVNTGVCTVGAVGSPSRLDYTAIGDVVNAAARLEAATKEAGADILIGPETYLELDPADRAKLGCRDAPRVLELKGVGRIPAYPVDVD